ncbi:hypothetical protein AGMMS49983_15540 [Clostridia bacterium]|nr:hypothetical protein AGMMS49983_15540 [Clostridia bacterium]
MSDTKDEKVKKFIELYFGRRLNEFNKIADYKKLSNADVARNTYKTIDEFFICELEITSRELEELKKVTKKFDIFYKAYINGNDDRKKWSERENGLNLYDWFITNDEGEKCGYCGITQDQLSELAKMRGTEEVPNITLNNKQKRKNGTMEIDKIDADGKYESENCKFACPFCNNAKSNLISGLDWEKRFAKVMKRYLIEELEKEC